MHWDGGWLWGASPEAPKLLRRSRVHLFPDLVLCRCAMVPDPHAAPPHWPGKVLSPLGSGAISSILLCVFTHVLLFWYTHVHTHTPTPLWLVLSPYSPSGFLSGLSLFPLFFNLGSTDNSWFRKMNRHSGTVRKPGSRPWFLYLFPSSSHT